MKIQYKLLGKVISVTVDLYGFVTIPVDTLDLIISEANKAYDQGYAKAKREEYETNRSKLIENLKG